MGMATVDVQFTAEELARYHRQMILPGIGREGQEALKRARVLIIGMGGLGSPVSLYLAAAGVGTLGLCDMDHVDLSNLHRQVLHDTASRGVRKIESAVDRLRALNPHTHFHLHGEGIQVGNAAELLAHYDLVVDGSDNFPTRYLVNDACALAGKPLVYGSIFQFEGQVSFFHAAEGTPCYRCLFPTMPAPGEVPNCAEAGVFGALAGIIGSLQALEALKYLTGVGENLRGRLLVVDGLTMGFRTLTLKRDPECPLCGSAPSITTLDEANYVFQCEPELAPTMHADIPLEISVEDAAALMGGQEGPFALPNGERPLVLDVREADEVAICAIEGHRHIPLKQLPERWESLPADRLIIVHCHHGMRSLRATHFLRDKGLALVTNMAGGIDAWAEEVDPGMQRY